MSLSRDLYAVYERVRLLENAATAERNEEVVWRYYYDKGALDYRDKLMEAMGAIPKDRSASEAFMVLLGTFPDPYPGDAVQDEKSDAGESVAGDEEPG